MKTKRFRPLQILCPNCGVYFPHDCAMEMGRLGKGRSSPRKLAASRANAAKGREVIERNRTQAIELTKTEIVLHPEDKAEFRNGAMYLNIKPEGKEE